MNCDAVIVHYGPYEPTIEVASKATAWAASVVVVANDLSVRPVGLPDEVSWVVPERNLGFGAAFNMGAEHGFADIVSVLNNDIELTTAAMETCINEFSNDDNISIVGPSLRFADGSVQSSVGSYSTMTGWPTAAVPIPLQSVECDWVTGAVMLVRRSFWSGHKMDETYFLGCEDAEFCNRARAAGGRVVLVPVDGAVHFSSKVISGPRWSYYNARNHLWFARYNAAKWQFAAMLALLVCRTFRVGVADVVKRRGFLRSKSMIFGLRDGLNSKPALGEAPLLDEPIPAKWMEW